MFETELAVKLHDTDAAGIVFFANYFKLAHDAYEAFMRSIDLDLGLIIRERHYLLPVVHAEAEYKKPLALGAVVTVSISADVGDTSFVLDYSLRDGNNDLVGQVQTVHVAVDKKTMKKIPLPGEIRQGLLTI